MGIKEIGGFHPGQGKPVDGSKPGKTPAADRKAGKRGPYSLKQPESGLSLSDGKKRIEEFLAKLPDTDIQRSEIVEDIRKKVESGFYDDPSVTREVAEVLTEILRRE